MYIPSLLIINPTTLFYVGRDPFHCPDINPPPQSVIQKNALEDTAVTNKMQWDNSISFMERILNERIDSASDALEATIGPSWAERWRGWRSRTPLENQCVAAKNELERLLVADESHGKHLENDELTTVRRNLQTQGVDVPYEIVRLKPH